MAKPYETETRGHEWRRLENGEIDIDAASGLGSWHNGPQCIRCGYGFCHHCQDIPSKDCPVVPTA